MVLKTPVDSTTRSAPASPPFDVGGIPLLEDGDGLPIDDKFPVLSLDRVVEFAMGRVILEHVHHVVEVNEEVIDGDTIHFARVISRPGVQMPNMAKSVHSNLHGVNHPSCLRDIAGTAPEDVAVCQVGGAESLQLHFIFIFYFFIFF